jgi:hypothetical protein
VTIQRWRATHSNVFASYFAALRISVTVRIKAPISRGMTPALTSDLSDLMGAPLRK